ncbi:MAG: ABC transporter permease subunit [Rubrivivax sp.]|nr:MAG: ABC transporter permease subunit [Rubrivivax sp.]
MSPGFPDWGTPLRDSVNALLEALISRHGDQFEAVSATLLKLLVPLEQGLRGAPAWVTLLAVAALAGAVSRRWHFALAVAGGLWLIGALGQWDQAMQSLALVIVAVLLCLVMGLPLGVLCARSALLRSLVTPLLDLMQTIPSFVYLLPAAMLFGLGKVPAILATVIYALPPLVRLTDLGLRQVPLDALEAGRVLGANRWQVLVRIQVPMAWPAILQGLNQTTMMSLAMVVVASMIGARGVGETVLIGLQRNDPGLGLVGGLVIVVLAMVLDRSLQAAGRRHSAPPRS